MIRILIVDDLNLVCEGIKAIVAIEKDIEVVGIARDGKEAIAQIPLLEPDVVVLDLLMPVMGGSETTKHISKQFPKVKILILSSYEDESVISEVLAGGANGYLLKDAITDDVAQAIRSVYQGSSHFAPGILNALAKNALRNFDSKSSGMIPNKICTIDLPPAAKAQLAVAKPKAALVAQAKPNKKAKQPKPEKPLFPYGDWAMLFFGVTILSQIDGMGPHLGHAGLFFLMLALLARPLKATWGEPLKHRRAIGIFAFAAALAHAIYATVKVLGGDLGMISRMSPAHQLGMWTGVVSLALMAPAAITSFKSFQRKLGKQWRQIHLLTVPSLALAVMHTVLIGPHYMAEFKMEIFDHIRSYGVIIVSIAVILIRRRIIILSSSKQKKTPTKIAPAKAAKVSKEFQLTVAKK